MSVNGDVTGTPTPEVIVDWVQNINPLNSNNN
jgi:hypothetical protein